MYLQRFSPLYRLICLAFILGCARAKNNITITKIECLNYSPTLLKNVSCHLNQTTSGTGAFSIMFSLTEDWHEVKGHLLFSSKRGSSIINYLSVDIDFCQILVSQHSHIITKKFINDFRRFSNFPYQCPYEKNKLYYINGASVDAGILPSYLPELSFIANTKVNYKNKKVIQFLLHGNIFRS